MSIRGRPITSVSWKTWSGWTCGVRDAVCGTCPFAGTGGVNVNFVEVAGEGTLKVRTYERGVEDETLACGTGSVAAAVVASRVRFPQVRSIDVQVRGGLLNVAFDVVGGRFSDVRLTGPARRVYSGVFRPENF